MKFTAISNSSVKRILIVLSMWLFSNAFTYGQKETKETKGETVYVESYGLEEGLRQSMVSSIHQDSLGVIWVVSGDGLHCFDGRKFKAYRFAYNGNYHHSDNMMRRITGADKSEFMIASSSSLIRFNPLTANYKFIHRELSVYVVLFDVQITNSSLAWTLNKGFCLATNDSLVPLKITYGNSQKPPAYFVPKKAVWYNKHTLLILGEEGIIHLSLSNNSSGSSYKALWEYAPGCKEMTASEAGDIFITRGNVLYKYPGKGSWIPISDTDISIGSVLHIDRMGNFWFTDRSGQNLYRLKNREISEIELFENSERFPDTINTTIKCLYEDRSGNLWIGTDGKGLLKYNPDKVIFNKALTGFTRCLASSDDFIYAGTCNNGLWKVTEDFTVAKRLNPKVFDNEYILDITIDKNGRLWAVTRTAIFVVTTDGKILWSFPGNCSSANFIYLSKDTIEVVRDSELLTFTQSSIPRIASREARFELKSYAYAFNKYWLITGSGLYISTSNIKKTKGKSPGRLLSGSEIFDLTIINNEIWASTGNGVEIYSADGKRINIANGVKELENEAIYSLESDSEGRIWFMGLRGIGFITTKRDRVVRFGIENNLQSLEFNNNAAIITKSGLFIFGGINGINAIDPSKIKPAEKTTELIRIFSLKVSDTNYVAGILPGKTTIEINRKHPSVEGNVVATGYRATGNSGFSFFLEGYQAEWSKPSADAFFSYRNLQPGDYKLYVKYIDLMKLEDPPQLLLDIHIDPAFWQTPWFYLVIVFSIIVVTVIIVKRLQSIRYGNLIRELEREKAIEKERIRISKDMHDEVGASLTRISILTELAKKHQFQSSKSLELINNISVIASDVVDELSEIIWAMNPKNDSLESFASHLRRYAGTYLESTGINIKYDFPDNIPPKPMNAELRRNLILIVKEALNNIVKHAKADYVILRIDIVDQTLSITIKDNGKGDVFLSESISGNGIHNMHYRALELGGTFEIESCIGKGTEISISVSLEGVSNSH